jgi:hypothetical protein
MADFPELSQLPFGLNRNENGDLRHLQKKCLRSGTELIIPVRR